MTVDVESISMEQMTRPEDLAQLVLVLINLSNSASVAELVVNCRADVVA